MLVTLTKLLAVSVLLGLPLGPSETQRDDRIGFTVEGESQHWKVSDLFTPADFDTKTPDRGFEFSPMLTFRGPATRVRWFRVEPLFPEPVTTRARPHPPKRGGCVIDIDSPSAEGALLRPGQLFTFGRCSVYPWDRGTTELARLVNQGIYLIAWEDDTGVKAEPVLIRSVIPDR